MTSMIIVAVVKAMIIGMAVLGVVLITLMTVAVFAGLVWIFNKLSRMKL